MWPEEVSIQFIWLEWTRGTFKPPATVTATVEPEVCGDRMSVVCSFLAACTQLFPDRGHETRREECDHSIFLSAI